MRAFLTLLLISALFGLQAQQISLNENYSDSTSDRKRLNQLSYALAGGYALSMTGLYFLWYDGYPQSNFHFFNDNNEWLQMDKVGHATTAYQVGRYGYDAFRWAGMPENKAVWIGGTVGFAFLMTVEIFDGFSAEWGASSGDLIANTTGTALFIGQQLLWKEQRISLKYSYHSTQYRQYRPDLLGANWFQALLKDYNGQTYWLAVNPKSFLPESSKFPSWLDLAFGYSARGMTGASVNSSDYNGTPIPDFNRRRVWLFSPDINLRKIPTNRKGLKFLFTALSFIKVPLPAIAFDKQEKIQFHWIYF
ncbi:MAG: YfiM family protein [Bacteroidetes bacterium]|nr:YfiM family protein [Bacteroidota bacterium]MBU1579986.1 YfiM family protein [Bacteroidota bacterium]MBU2559017.1 YfiM family protein [Bacteroidota bacterium]